MTDIITMITDIRETTPDPFFGEYFQWLAERIDERMKKNPRQPYYLQTGSKRDIYS